MTKKKRPGTNETKPSRDDDAKIGRGSPPRHTQFKKGKSGNPKGRPKGSKNLSTLLMTAANDQVAATISGKPRKISKLQATTMQLATKAASGDMKAMVDDQIDSTVFALAWVTMNPRWSGWTDEALEAYAHVLSSLA